MPAALFDTLRYVETLTAAGVHESQAKAGVVALANAFGELSSGFLATKSDIAELRAEIHSVRAELKSDIAEVRAEIHSVRAELKSDIADVRSELKLIKWMNVTVVAAIVSYVSRSFF